MIKHTIITKKPKVVVASSSAAIIPSDTATGNIRHYPLASNMATIQAAIDAAREGHEKWMRPKNAIVQSLPVIKKIKNQPEFNEFLDQIKVSQGEYATFNASRRVNSIFQIYYVHYVEVDIDKVSMYEHDGTPCAVQTIFLHESQLDRSPVEWQNGLQLRPLSQEEIESNISDTVRNRIQERIRILQQTT